MVKFIVACPAHSQPIGHTTRFICPKTCFQWMLYWIGNSICGIKLIVMYIPKTTLLVDLQIHVVEGEGIERSLKSVYSVASSSKGSKQ